MPLTREHLEWIKLFTINGQTRLPEGSRGRAVAIEIVRMIDGTCKAP